MTNSSAPKQTRSRIGILVSGGLDSSVLLQEGLSRGLEVFPLYVAAGFLWEEAELYWLRQLLAALTHSRLQELCVLENPLRDLFPKHWAFTGLGVPDAASPDQEVYLPGRNLQLLSQATVYAQSRNLEEIWIGVLSANPFSDGQSAFFKSFQESCRLGLPRPLRIEAPFQGVSKADLVLRHPDFPYELTFSCIQPLGHQPCGACNKCVERRKAFRAMGITSKMP